MVSIGTQCLQNDGSPELNCLDAEQHEIADIEA